MCVDEAPETAGRDSPAAFRACFQWGMAASQGGSAWNLFNLIGVIPVEETVKIWYNQVMHNRT